MKEESENFEQLRRILALKRHEQPPPGYFDRFPGEVISRLRAGEKGEGVPQGWAQRLWALLEAKPAFAGAFGVAICAVIVSGILNSEESGLASSPGADSMLMASPFSGPADALTASVIQSSGSEMTNGASPLSDYFDNYPTAQPAGFQLLEPQSILVR